MTLLNAASAELQAMGSRVEITGNTAQAGSIQVNNVAHPAPSLEDIDRCCLRALRCPNPMAVKHRLKENKDKLLPKSIEWILKHPQYKTWQDGDDVCLLWIKGGAGKGKTMMSIGIIEDLSRLYESTIVTYFFCQSADCEHNTLEAIIKGLIFQLVYQQPSLNHQPGQALRRRWDTTNNCFYDSEDLSSWRALWDVFLEMLEYCKCQRVYIIVDALDECQSDSMADFLKLLVRNGLDRPSKIKWMLTSRPLDTAERELLTGYEQVQVSLELNLSSVSEAVKIYVSSKMTELDRRHLYGEQLKLEIQTKLIKKAKSTFLWVSLVGKELESVCRKKALTTIRNLPSGLYPFYNQILIQLSKGERADVQKYIRLFTVMMLVYRPLKLEEIRSVTGLTDEEDAIKLLVDQCASLIQLQENKIEFVHKSARDYLAGEDAQSFFPPSEHFGPDEIAYGCLSYLSESLTPNLVKLTRFDSGPQSLKELKDEKKEVLLARVDYAATFWVQHLEDTKKSLLSQSNLPLVDTVIIYLQTKFLEWLECMSLLGMLPQAMEALKTLANLARVRPPLPILTCARCYTIFVTTLSHYSKVAAADL
ncbi:unnamed protein product [Penicillium salamii]|nr:unnamed protein product [Penicillium salamii]CAG8364626.1 unnamed protein product [Penicillium salamii]